MAEMTDDEIEFEFLRAGGTAKCDSLTAAISGLLAGEHPGIQGAVISELVAIWLCGHDERTHSTLLRFHAAAAMKMAAQLIEQRRERVDGAKSFARGSRSAQ